CYQCEQTAREAGCTSHGVCGKDPETAAVQDLLVHVCKGIGWYASRLPESHEHRCPAGRFVTEALFTTVTNVNFDPETIAPMVKAGSDLMRSLRAEYHKIRKSKGAEPDVSGLYDDWEVNETSVPDLERLGTRFSPRTRVERFGADVSGLAELVMYGLKGTAAYAHHARVLGIEDDAVYGFFHEALGFLADEPADTDQLLAMTLKVGEVNLKVMEMLDRANTGTYGHPEPTEVRTTPVAGKCILVSGHDLKDLYELLLQTEGKGINVYTHGEMLPCHGYPELKRFKHLAGNYGGAWQDQRKEFDQFPGAILMTTNCIQKPRTSYQDRLFTCGLVQWPGVKHIDSHDFSEVISAAERAPGFEVDADPAFTHTGFGHNAVTGLADKVVDAVKAGRIKHFYLIGGCDGAKSGRNYYTEAAQAVPEDAVIMTLACGKFRFNKLEFGDIDGIPRLLDVGQCNDAYSAIKIAGALAEAFDCDVNDLPLSLVLSWYEQKAVCILLTLLHLGIKDIKIGPSLPAFIGKGVLDILVAKFALKPIKDVETDIHLAPAV
ncbi:hydroxylamine reductase, partial [candidate division GN15 bacterium]|nr:hydroxylamine reductase [candidate division GN15 bacterium]